MIPKISLIAMFLTAFASLALQTVPATPELTSQVERLGLVGALMTAVIVLWRSLATLQKAKDQDISKKDDLIMEMTRQVSQALTVSTDTQRELRETVKESVHAKEELTAAIEHLSKSVYALPCTLKNRD